MAKQSVFVSLSGVEDRSKTFSFLFTCSPAFATRFFVFLDSSTPLRMTKKQKELKQIAQSGLGFNYSFILEFYHKVCHSVGIFTNIF